ncbi:MAG: ABC transporter ATP-binding protein [Sphingomicrobium sp.]
MNRFGKSALVSLGRDFARFAGARLWTLLTLMVGGAIAEGLGLLLIVPLAAIALGEESQLPRWMVDPFAGVAAGDRLIFAILLFLAAMAARVILLFWRDNLRARLQSGYQASLQLRAAATLAETGWEQAKKVGQAGMQSLLLNDVPRSVQAIAYMLEFAVVAVLLAVQLALAAVLSPALALFAVAVLAPGFLAVRVLTRRMVRSGEAVVAGFEDSTGAGLRLQLGLKSALAQGNVPQFLAEYRSSLDGLAGDHVRFARDFALSRQIVGFATALAAVLMLVAGARVLVLPFPILAASLVLFARMASPAVTLLHSAQQALALAPAFAAIGRRLGQLIPPQARDQQRSESLPLDWSTVELAGVSYCHDSGRGIDDVSLVIRRGEWVGISGPSAAGKTTLADLAACLLKPDRGSLLIDGRPLADDQINAWRAGIAYLGQDGLVFADSVAANLIAGQGEADDSAMWNALEAVGLADRVRSFADGLHHPLGEGGSTLSGGERQRLLIARALLRRPTFLILDEATAALDPEAEAQVLIALRRLDTKPAAILIAHRESTLSHCDSAIALQHGRAEGSGRPLSRRSPTQS